MPLPADDKVVENSKEIVDILQKVFGKHPGYRPAHAKGLLFKGTFTPSSTAAGLSSAKHFKDASTQITVRFSDSTGIPQIPDNDGNANPNGIAVRFHLGNDENGRRVHTDIVAHSTPFFPAKDGQEFLDFFKAIAANEVPAFLGSHPNALAFVQAPKPFAVSFATQAFYGVTAIKFISAEGKETYVRYRIIPVLGHQTLDDAAAKEKGPNYLFDDIKQRVSEGPVVYKLNAQLAEEGDVTDDATKHWPEDRKVVELGEIKVEQADPDEASLTEQKKLIFDPIPRVQGLAPSADPLLDTRAAVYLISGRERRAA
jgi:catalase